LRRHVFLNNGQEGENYLLKHSMEGKFHTFQKYCAQNIFSYAKYVFVGSIEG
jgi:hypothetical protein